MEQPETPRRGSRDVIVVLFGAVLLAVAGLVAFWFWKPPSPETTLVYEYETLPSVGDQARLVEVVTRRLNQPSHHGMWRVRSAGRNQIEISVLDDHPAEVARVTRLLARRGALQFRVTANMEDHVEWIREARGSRETILRNPSGDALAFWVPVRKQVKALLLRNETFIHRSEKGSRGEEFQVLVVSDPYDVSDKSLSRVRPGVDSEGSPCVLLTFSPDGTRRFAGLIGDNLPTLGKGFHRHLGILLDGQLYSAVTITGRIDGSCQIAGGLTLEEVDDLAALLDSGSLPVELKFVRQVESNQHQ